MSKATNNPDIQPYVLIIEHDPELRKIMEISLDQAGVKVEAVSRVANALQILQEEQPDVFVIDCDLGKGGPEKLISSYRKNQKDNVGTVIVSTTNRLKDSWRREYKPDSVIYKPFDIRYLVRSILLHAQNRSVPV
jgi:DNA-binding response OmpR family regulator